MTEYPPDLIDMPGRRRIFIGIIALAIAVACVCLLVFLLWPTNAQKNALLWLQIETVANFGFEPHATRTVEALPLAKLPGALDPLDLKALGGLASITAARPSQAAVDLINRLTMMDADRSLDSLWRPSAALAPGAAAENLADVGAVVQGVNDQPAADVAADDQPTATAGPVQTYPLSTAALSDQQRRAARYGAQGIAPGGVNIMASADVAATVPAQRAAGARPRAFDASEGTPLDPLLNTTYDLNYPKVVPSLK